ncbi:MAG: flavodoxin family protein [Eubacteriales bacterium]
MKQAIVYSSATGNTKLLAETIQKALGSDVSIGGVSEDALNADVVYVGSWAQAFTCTADIKEFLEKLNNKKVFLFMTAGYGNTDDFFQPIMDSVKANVNDTNEIIGTYICQGKVSEGKQEAIKKMDMAKYESMKAKLDESVSHPSKDDLEKLTTVINAIS